MIIFSTIIVSIVLLLSVVFLKSSHPSPMKMHYSEILVLSFVLLTSGGVYLLVGSPESLFNNEPKNSTVTINEIKQRIKSDEKNVVNWNLLAKKLMRTNDYSGAIHAYQKVLKYSSQQNIDTFIKLADAYILLNKGAPNPDSESYLQKAYTINNKNPKVLWLLGLTHIQKQNKEKARHYWQQLLPLLQESPKQQAQLSAIIQETYTNEDTMPLAITVKLSIAKSLQGQVKQNDTVFIVAKSPQQKIPVAVKKISVEQLTPEIVFRDTDIMLGGQKLRNFSTLLFSARIVKSNTVQLQKGDLYSPVVTVSTEQNAPVSLIINKKKQ